MAAQSKVIVASQVTSGCITCSYRNLTFLLNKQILWRKSHGATDSLYSAQGSYVPGLNGFPKVKDKQVAQQRNSPSTPRGLLMEAQYQLHTGRLYCSPAAFFTPGSTMQPLNVGCGSCCMPFARQPQTSMGKDYGVVVGEALGNF